MAQLKVETGFLSGDELNHFISERIKIYSDILGEDFTPLHSKAAEALRLKICQYHASFPVRINLLVYDTKLRQLLSVTKRSDMEEILKPSKSYYELNSWHPCSKYHFELDELLILSVAALQAPLSSEYTERMVDLTNRLYKASIL